MWLLAAGVPSWAVAGVGIDLARGIPGSAAFAAGHGEIPWFGYFAVAHSEVFGVEVKTRPLTVGTLFGTHP